MGVVSEETLNVVLAQLLLKRGLRSLGEARIRGPGIKKPDVFMVVNGVKVILEGKYRRAGARKELEEKCRERIDDGLCEICISAEYPFSFERFLFPTMDDVKRMLLNKGVETNIAWVSAEGIKTSGWVSTKIDDLATLVRNSYTSVVSEDILGKAVANLAVSLDVASKKVLQIPTIDVLATRVRGAMGLLKVEAGRSGGKMNEDSARVLKMAELALVDAMIFQEVLAGSYPDIPTLSQIAANPPIQQGLINAWVEVLKRNYASIFELGISILRSLPSHPFIEESLGVLVAEAQRIASSKALLRHDLMGRIYHGLLLANIAKYFATYYTSVPAAWLLARLSLETDNPLWSVDWSDAEGVSSFRVGDLACGSGTLLSASYRAILDKHIISSAFEGLDPKPDRIHRVLLEDVLWGFDVLPYATHLAVTGLSLHNPASVFDRSNIYTLVMSGKGKELRLGSVDFLVEREISATNTLAGESVGVERRGVESAERGGVRLPDFDLIIMNPPFTRSVGGNLLFGTLPKEERAKLQKRLSEILKVKGFSGIGQAGLGAVFIALGDRYLKDGGRMALVCPRSLISGIAWRKIRDLLLNDYEVEYIITSHEAPGGWNFSENTDLDEVLLVARKVGEGVPKKTIIANLWRKPVNEMESIIIASQLRGLKGAALNELHDVLENQNSSHFNLILGGRKVGEAYTVTYETFKDAADTWGQLAPFAQSELNRVAYVYISSGQIYLPGRGVVDSVGLTKLGNVASVIGPDVRQIHSTFRTSVYQTPYSALWNHRSEEIRAIQQQPNMWLEPKPGKGESANSLWRRSGRLMVAERLRLNTHRVVASYLTSGALANVWWPVRLKEAVTSEGVLVSAEEHEKIQVLWVNTTFGIFGLLAYRQDTEGAWVKFKKEILNLVPILDLSKLTREQVDGLLATFDRFCGSEMEPLPDQFSEAASGIGVRREMDLEVLKTLTGKEIGLKPLYECLAEEPIISLNPLPGS